MQNSTDSPTTHWYYGPLTVADNIQSQDQIQFPGVEGQLHHAALGWNKPTVFDFRGCILMQVYN